MAIHLRYARATYTPADEIVPGNSVARDPVQFDLVPAEGADLARIKSMIVATAGLILEGDWSPEMQRAVEGAFRHGAPAFIATVEAVRGLTIPAAMAVRVGLLKELPQRVAPGMTTLTPDPEAPVPITTGLHYSLICGFLPVLSMWLAKEVTNLSAETGIDPRFFVSPSGSPGAATGAATPSVATAVPTAPEGPETAA